MRQRLGGCIGTHDDASYDEFAVARLVESRRVGRGEGDVGHRPGDVRCGPATTMSGGRRRPVRINTSRITSWIRTPVGAGTATTAVP